MGHEHPDNTCGDRQSWSGQERDGKVQYSSKIPENIKIQQVQKCVLLGILLLMSLRGVYPANKPSHPHESPKFKG